MLDTPFYINAADGERMVAERVADFRRSTACGELARRARLYLTFEDFERMTQPLT